MNFYELIFISICLTVGICLGGFFSRSYGFPGFIGGFLAAFISLFALLGLANLISGIAHSRKIKKQVQKMGVFVALGSNLGDSQKIILDAVRRFQKYSHSSILKSSLWQTSPVDCPPDSPKFVNAVVGFVPRKSETPESLLEKLRELEKEFGRAPKTILNEPRPLDLDLIAFGNEIRNSPELILPHPRAHLRRFVLQPLSEIEPDLVLPGQTKSVLDILCDLPEAEAVVWLSSPI